MRDSRLPRTSILLLLLVTFGCSKSDDAASTGSLTETSSTSAAAPVQTQSNPAPAGSDEVCTAGNASRSKPVICVRSDAKPDPSSKPAWDQEKKKDGQPSGRAVTVRWLAKDESKDMTVTFDDKTCVDQVDAKCKKNSGECEIELKKGAAPNTKCTYKIKLYDADDTAAASLVEESGDLIVNPCCT